MTHSLSLRQYLKRSTTIHNHKALGALCGNLHHTKVNTLRYGIRAFRYQGIQVLNKLKQRNVYQNAKTKGNCLRDLKSYLISKYTTRLRQCLCVDIELGIWLVVHLFVFIKLLSKLFLAKTTYAKCKLTKIFQPCCSDVLGSPH